MRSIRNAAAISPSAAAMLQPFRPAPRFVSLVLWFMNSLRLLQSPSTTEGSSLERQRRMPFGRGITQPSGAFRASHRWAAEEKSVGGFHRRAAVGSPRSTFHAPMIVKWPSAKYENDDPANPR